MGDILRFPGSKIVEINSRRRLSVSTESCFTCANAYIGRDGVICEISRDLVQNPEIAGGCEAYENDGVQGA